MKRIAKEKTITKEENVVKKIRKMLDPEQILLLREAKKPIRFK